MSTTKTKSEPITEQQSETQWLDKKQRGFVSLADEFRAATQSGVVPLTNDDGITIGNLLMIIFFVLFGTLAFYSIRENAKKERPLTSYEKAQSAVFVAGAVVLGLATAFYTRLSKRMFSLSYAQTERTPEIYEEDIKYLTRWYTPLEITDKTVRHDGTGYSWTIRGGVEPLIPAVRAYGDGGL